MSRHSKTATPRASHSTHALELYISLPPQS